MQTHIEKSGAAQKLRVTVPAAAYRPPDTRMIVPLQ
jgi:hypothetical protein